MARGLFYIYELLGSVIAAEEWNSKTLKTCQK